MAGTKIGGNKAAATNKARYGADYYEKLGKKGVKAYKKRLEAGVAEPRGFALMKANGQTDKIREAGKKGGSVSRRVTYN